MPEYIEREALMEVVNNLRFGKHLNKEAALNLMERAINNLPAADVVAVVRCKDCKWHANRLCYHPRFDYVCEIPPTARTFEFCSYGERREEDGA